MISKREASFLAILALIAAYFLVWPLWRAFFPLEIAPNEAWNGYYQDAAAAGAQLYPPADALIINNYPPLSFYLIGWLGKLFGDPLYVGRALSIVATFGLGVTVALAIRQLGGGKVAAAIGGLWFVAVMAGAFNRFVGMNDPQLLAQFMMAAALVWFLARDAKGQSAEPPILLMVIAGFCKHNIIVMPATVLLWLALRDGRRALRPILFGAGAAALGLALCIAIVGDLFLVNLLATRRYNWIRTLSGLGRLQWLLPALIIVGIWAWHDRRTAAARFIALFAGLGVIIFLLQWSGEAVVDNAQFDLLIAVAVGVGLTYERIAALAPTTRWSAERLRSGMIVILVIRLLATSRIMSALILFDPHYRAEFQANSAIARQEAARVAAIPGLVGCVNKSICRMAGKSFVFDDFKTEEAVGTGRMTEKELQEMMRQRGIQFVPTDFRAMIDPLNRDLFQDLVVPLFRK